MNFRFQKYVAPACLFLIARHAGRARRGFPACFPTPSEVSTNHRRSPEHKYFTHNSTELHRQIAIEAGREWIQLDAEQ